MMSRKNRISPLKAAVRVAVVGLGACAVDTGVEEENTTSAPEAVTCPSPVIEAGRSLFVTEATVLDRFQLRDVMDRIIATAGTGARQTPLQLYQQWWDHNNDDARGRTAGPHCNSIPMPIQCPRQEGALAATDPFASPASNPHAYIPLALVNRFDLAPVSGANCGEYRIVYGKRSGLSSPGDRNFIIFEAKLPNPSPEAGLAGCRGVAELWADLSTAADAAARADRLHAFYFDGLSGFRPVIHWEHYRGTSIDANSGQIRTNQFVSRISRQPWLLREYRLESSCPTPTACALVMRMATDKENPRGALFAEVAAGGGLTPFQQDFVDIQVPQLLGATVSEIGMSTADSFNHFDSVAQGPENDYRARAGGSAAFLRAIQRRLASLGSTLTPANVLDRATAQSCAGCHAIAAGRSLGGGLTWPLSLGFTHVREDRGLSPALTQPGGFLDRRREVLRGFLCAPPGARAASAGKEASLAGGDEEATLGGFRH